MTVPSLGKVVLASILLQLSIAAVPRSSRAQGVKEVEIEIAGPWDYVADPSHSDRIIVIAPFPDHALYLFSGGNALSEDPNRVPFPAGFYTLDFDQTFDPQKCSAHTPLKEPKPYKLKVNGSTSNSSNPVSDALGAKGNRYAISLPKPCFYESYSDVRVKVKNGQISEQDGEKSYTIWMVLHYTVPDTMQSALLNGPPDAAGSPPYKDFPVKFDNSTVPPTATAISLVMYFGSVANEDFACDRYSAHLFDVDQHLWQLKKLSYRLFPELNATRAQTHRYNHDVTKCPQTELNDFPEPMIHSLADVLGNIDSVRRFLKAGKIPEAQKALSEVEAQGALFWAAGQVPQVVKDDFKNSEDVLKELTKNSERRSNVDFDKFLSITEKEYERNPGRADCHKMQVSVNGAVQ
jgi:hypothetical protein